MCCIMCAAYIIFQSFGHDWCENPLLFDVFLVDHFDSRFVHQPSSPKILRKLLLWQDSPWAKWIIPDWWQMIDAELVTLGYQRGIRTWNLSHLLGCNWVCPRSRISEKSDGFVERVYSWEICPTYVSHMTFHHPKWCLGPWHFRKIACKPKPFTALKDPRHFHDTICPATCFGWLLAMRKNQENVWKLSWIIGKMAGAP